MSDVPNRAGDTTRRPADTFPHFDEVTDPKVFQKKLAEAAAANPHGSSVTVNPASSYKGHRMFLTPDSKAGYAVSPQGELVSVFKHPEARYEDVGRRAAEHGILIGGATHLNAYDPKLPQMYSKAQFQPVARIPFNEEYKPAGWSGGSPDVVFMAANPRGNKNTDYKPGTGKKMSGDQYDDALNMAAKRGSKIKTQRENKIAQQKKQAGI